jgi:hypothetical protein
MKSNTVLNNKPFRGSILACHFDCRHFSTNARITVSYILLEREDRLQGRVYRSARQRGREMQ